MSGNAPLLVLKATNGWFWACRECHGADTAFRSQGAALRDARDHLRNHCPSTYAHRDQPDHQEDQ